MNITVPAYKHLSNQADQAAVIKFKNRREGQCYSKSLWLRLKSIVVIPNKKEPLHCTKIKWNGANVVFVASIMRHLSSSLFFTILTTSPTEDSD